MRPDPLVLRLVFALVAVPAASGVLRERCAWSGTARDPAVDDVLCTPVAIDLDADGRAEIAFVARDTERHWVDGVLVVMDGECNVRLEIWDPGPAPCVGDAFARDLDPGGDGAVHFPDGVAAGDLDGDGVPEIVAVLSPESTSEASPRRLVAYRADGSLFWCSQAAPPTPMFGTGPMDVAVPFLADMDADGRPEIVVGTAVFSWDGRLLAANMDRRVHGLPSVPVDADGDGRLEIAVGAALLRGDTTLAWRRDDWTGFVPPSTPVDLDGDGIAELVVSNDGASVVALLDAATGTMHGGVVVPADDVSCSGQSGSAAAGDMDGDGRPEIAVVTGTWLCRIDHADAPLGHLSLRWSRRVSDCFAGWVSPILADVTGDGLPEILLRDVETLWIYSASGDVLQALPSTSGTAWESVVAADVAGDCAGEIVVAADDAVMAGAPGVRVFEGDDAPLPAYRPAWNQTAWQGTNAGDHGSIPSPLPVSRSFRLQVEPEPPVVSVSVSPETLWPPNHRWVRLALSEESGLPVRVAAVRQDEPLDDLGDGAFEPDAVIDADGVLLRAERSGRGDGRTYHLELVVGFEPCTVTATVTACVPHDRSLRSCVDQGPLHDSLGR